MRLALLVCPLVACSPEGRPVESVDGVLTWTVDFDGAAEARGFEDCDYSRRYDGLTDRSAPWLCPECDVVFRAEAELKQESCYAQISEEAPSPVDWLGWAGSTFYRASTENLRLTEQGTAKVRGGARVVRHRADPIEIKGGGRFVLSVEGELEVAGSRGDPMWGYGPAKSPSCGWDRLDPEPYEGDWLLRRDAIIPDGWFHDACGQGVRLHDQLGGYLVVEVSAMDCPPCQDMAAGEESFRDELALAGVEVRVATLLAPTLDRVVDPMPRKGLNEWTEAFGISQPVLGDRGWGFWLGIEALGDGFGYPMVVVARPDGTVLDVRTGFGGWDSYRRMIKDDAGI